MSVCCYSGVEKCVRSLVWAWIKATANFITITSFWIFIRLKPVHKVEGMTNGTAAGAGQQQQQQQGLGQVDISTQVQQYQQFLGELSKDEAFNLFKKKCMHMLLSLML